MAFITLMHITTFMRGLPETCLGTVCSGVMLLKRVHGNLLSTITLIDELRRKGGWVLNALWCLKMFRFMCYNKFSIGNEFRIQCISKSNLTEEIQVSRRASDRGSYAKPLFVRALSSHSRV